MAYFIKAFKGFLILPLANKLVLHLKICFLVFVFAAISGACLAQSVVYEQDVKRYYTAEPWTLKPFMGLLPGQPRLQLQYEVTAKVVAAGGGQYTLALYVEQVQISGTTLMDGYDVSAALWPDSLTLFYKLELPGAVPLLSKTITESAYVLRDGLHEFLEPTTDWSRVRFTARIIRAKFGAKAQTLAQAKTSMALFSSTTGALGALSLDMSHFQMVQDPDTLLARQSELYVLEQNIPQVKSLLANRPFWLSEADAAVTQTLLQENNNLLADVKLYLKQQEANLLNLIAAKADKLFATARRSLALPYYKKVLDADPTNEKAADRFALLSLETGSPEEAARMLIAKADIMQGFSHQRTVDKTGRALEVSVLRYIQNDEPDFAKPQVYLLDSLCKKFPGYRCPNLAYTRTAAPVRDHYARLMNRARVETSLDQLDQALATIDNAIQTAQEGGLPLANQQSAYTLQGQVAERLITKTIYLSKTAYEKGQDSLATERLLLATNLVKKFRQSPPPLYAKLISNYTTQYVARLEGTLLQNQANAYKVAFNLVATKKQETLPAIASEPKQPKNTDCRRLQTEVNELVAKALKSERNLSFKPAKDAYLQALELARKKLDCGINQTFLIDKLGSIEPPATYQNLVEEAEAHLDEKQYDSAKGVLILAESLYESANLSAQFLQETTVSNTARNPRYAGFAIHLGQEYMSANNLDSALAMARIASGGRFSKDVFKEFMTILGGNLAGKDTTNTPHADALKQASMYTQGDKKLKELEKAYLKARGKEKP